MKEFGYFLYLSWGYNENRLEFKEGKLESKKKIFWGYSNFQRWMKFAVHVELLFYKAIFQFCFLVGINSNY